MLIILVRETYGASYSDRLNYTLECRELQGIKKIF